MTYVYVSPRVPWLTNLSRVQSFIEDGIIEFQSLYVIHDKLQKLASLFRKLPGEQHLAICKHMA